MGFPQSEKLTLKGKRHPADQTTNTKYKDDMRVQVFAGFSSFFKKHEKLVEAIFGECLNCKGGLRVS